MATDLNIISNISVSKEHIVKRKEEYLKKLKELYFKPFLYPHKNGWKVSEGDWEYELPRKFCEKTNKIIEDTEDKALIYFGGPYQLLNISIYPNCLKISTIHRYSILYPEEEYDYDSGFWELRQDIFDVIKIFGGSEIIYLADNACDKLSNYLEFYAEEGVSYNEIKKKILNSKVSFVTGYDKLVGKKISYSNIIEVVYDKFKDLKLKKMKLEELGYNKTIDKYIKENNFNFFSVGRVLSEHKKRYIVGSDINECKAEVVCKIKYSAQSRLDFPAVGDWVFISYYDDNKALIHSFFPRKSIIEQQSVKKKGEKQIIATNVDFAFIIQPIDRDYSISRIERYLTICNVSKVKPIIIFNKIDLIDTKKISKIVYDTSKRINNVPIYCISNETKQGIENLKKIIKKGKTYCLLGSSGVGKTSLINTLLGDKKINTKKISTHSLRGKHTTTYIQLHIIKNGGILIDNPGIREVGVINSPSDYEQTFSQIEELAKKCKYKDCSHILNYGCAVISQSLPIQ